MPTVTNNILLQGLSGKLGNFVVRQLNGKTIIQAVPVRKAPATPGELKNRETFRQAVAYAKEARLNPELWEIYTVEAKRRGGTSNAYAVAVSDYRKGLLLAGNLPGIETIKQKENKPELKRKKAAAGHFYTAGLMANAAPVYRLPENNGTGVYGCRKPASLGLAKMLNKPACLSYGYYPHRSRKDPDTQLRRPVRHYAAHLIGRTENRPQPHPLPGSEPANNCLFFFGANNSGFPLVYAVASLR